MPKVTINDILNIKPLRKQLVQCDCGNLYDTDQIPMLSREYINETTTALRPTNCLNCGRRDGWKLKYADTGEIIHSIPDRVDMVRDDKFKMFT